MTFSTRPEAFRLRNATTASVPWKSSATVVTTSPPAERTSVGTDSVDGTAGVDVSTESTAGSDATRTVVSFRHRG